MLNFNGAYNCSGTGDVLNCSIFCPKGISLEYAAAPVYSCNYANGEFLPRAVPQCVIGKCLMNIVFNSKECNVVENIL